METNSFKEYSVLAIMSKEEQQQMKACLMFLRAVFKPCEGSVYEQTFSVTNVIPKELSTEAINSST